MLKQFQYHIKTLSLFLLVVSLSSCGILGMHFKLHNPKKAGSYPKETPELLLFGTDNKHRTCFDVTHYDIHVQVDPVKKYLKGSVIVNATAINDFDTLQLDLHKNMKLNSVKSNDAVLQFTRKDRTILVKMPKRMKQGEKFSLLLSYEGQPLSAPKPPWRGGFVWKKDKNKNPWIGVACETEGASIWWPNKDAVSDEADSVDMHITVPKGLMTVSNGILRDSINNNETNTYHWHVSYPINNYNVTLYVGKFRLLPDTYYSSLTGKEIKLNHYVLPYNYEVAKTHFQQVKKHIAFYEEKFGEYPWPKDGFKLVESPYAGMEHQSAIAYGNGYKNGPSNPFDYIILHETAHEWWGNSVSAADLADGWIHEGFASYCEVLYVEKTQGMEASLNYLFLHRIMIKNSRPVVRKRGIRYFNYRDSDIYVKGSWILHTLRNTINDDELFFDILKTFRIENHQKQIYSEAFIDLVNKKTGKDYTWFFKQYLFRREAPMLEYYWNKNILYYRWTKVNGDFALPVRIKIGEKSIVLYPTTSVQEVEFSAEPVKFRFNDNKLLYRAVENKKLKKPAKKNN